MLWGNEITFIHFCNPISTPFGVRDFQNYAENSARIAYVSLFKGTLELHNKYTEDNARNKCAYLSEFLITQIQVRKPLNTIE